VQSGARAFGVHAPGTPGRLGLDASSAYLTVYVKERDPERSRVAAAGGHGATGSKDPKTKLR